MIEYEYYQNLSYDKKLNVDLVSKAFRSVTGKLSYLSTPISTGKRYYEVLDKYGVKTLESLAELKPDAFHSEILQCNVKEGLMCAEILSNNISECLVVPCKFEARALHWTQEEYMIVWLRLIGSNIKVLYLCEGWQYSSGSVMEYCRAVELTEGKLTNQKHIEVYELDSLYFIPETALTLDSGITKIQDALTDLNSRGHAAEKLKIELIKLQAIQASKEVKSEDAPSFINFQQDSISQISISGF